MRNMLIPIISIFTLIACGKYDNADYMSARSGKSLDTQGNMELVTSDRYDIPGIESKTPVRLQRSKKPLELNEVYANDSYSYSRNVQIVRDGNGENILLISTNMDAAWFEVRTSLEKSTELLLMDQDRSLGVFYINTSPSSSTRNILCKTCYQVRLSPVNKAVAVSVEKDIETSASLGIINNVLMDIKSNIAM